MDRVANIGDQIVRWVVRLTWLNLWWLLLTIAGGVILGAGPATVAAHVVATRWARGDTEVPIGSTMWRAWRQHWRRGTAASVLAAALVGALIITIRLTWSHPSPVQAAVAGLACGGLVLACIALPHIPRLTASTSLSITGVLLTALGHGLRHPVLTIAVLASTVGWWAGLVAIGWPGLLPVCGISVPVAAAAMGLERQRSSRPHSRTAVTI